MIVIRQLSEKEIIEILTKHLEDKDIVVDHIEFKVTEPENSTETKQVFVEVETNEDL